MQKQKRKRRSSKDFIIVLIIVVVSCLYIIGKQELEIYRVKQDEAATRQRIEELNAARQKMETERKQLDDPKYLERIARDEYNMVGKDEIPLFIVEEGKPQEEQGKK